MNVEIPLYEIFFFKCLVFFNKMLLGVGFQMLPFSSLEFSLFLQFPKYISSITIMTLELKIMILKSV